MTTVDPLRAALFLIVAFTMAGLMHSAWLRSSLSQRFAIPLDGGRTIRGRRVFGENKTVRGFAVMVPAAALSFAGIAALLARNDGAVPASIWALSIAQYAALGAWAGFAFMLAELPNSFVKRQLDIAPGQAPDTRTAALVCFAVDRLDSIVGMLVAVALVVPAPQAMWGWVILLGPGIHWAFSILLFRLGVKARPA